MLQKGKGAGREVAGVASAIESFARGDRSQVKDYAQVREGNQHGIIVCITNNPIKRPAMESRRAQSKHCDSRQVVLQFGFCASKPGRYTEECTSKLTRYGTIYFIY